jgi:hypothetical protein
MKKNINCIICDKLLRGKQTLYCCVKCKNQNHQSYDAQQLRGLRRKLELLEICGGKCCRCGYNKNVSALNFHHKDPENKEFSLDLRSLSNRTKDRVLSEFKKCVLLCNNCHSEVHNPHLDLASLSLSRLL